MAAEPTDQAPKLYGVEEVMKLLNVGRTKVYDEMDSGRLRSVKLGRRRLVSAAALNDFVEQLDAAAG